MSPRLTFALTLAGVVLAGLPLLWLTGKEGVAQAAPIASAAAPAGDIPVVITLRWSGEPSSLTLLHAGQVLGEVEPGQGGEGELECRLPRTACWEIELAAEWPEPQCATAQAVSLTLTPEALPERAETHWTYPGDSALHQIFVMKGVEP